MSHPYQTPGAIDAVAISGPDDNYAIHIEERIMDRVCEMRRLGNRSQLVARVGWDSFETMRLRLAAKVAENGQGSYFYIHTAGGLLMIALSSMIASEQYVIESLSEESEGVLNARLRYKLLERARQLFEQNADEQACKLVDAYASLRGKRL